MKLIARTAINEFAFGDKRPGDTFECDDEIGAALVAAERAEQVIDEGAEQKRARRAKAE